jgi:hypothetical protein
MSTEPDYGTIKRACREIGGDKPVHPSTYYRGVKERRYPPPEHPSPGISRVNIPKLRIAIAVGKYIPEPAGAAAKTETTTNHIEDLGPEAA